MKVKYQIVLDVTTDGTHGPLIVLGIVNDGLLHLVGEHNMLTPGYPLTLGKVRIAASYIVQDETEK